MNNSWQFVFLKIFVCILLVASLCKSGRAERVYIHVLKKLLSIDVPVGDGLWQTIDVVWRWNSRRWWSLMRSEMVSDAVRDGLWCHRYFCFSKSKSDFSEWRGKLACALPSAKAFRAKLKERFLITLQRYALFPTPPNRKAHGVQKSVKGKNKFSLPP